MIGDRHSKLPLAHLGEVRISITLSTCSLMYACEVIICSGDKGRLSPALPLQVWSSEGSTSSIR